MSATEGYFYFIIENNELESTYKECLEFDKFEKMEMLPPNSGKLFEI